MQTGEPPPKKLKFALSPAKTIPQPQYQEQVVTNSREPIVGTCTIVEKAYFRLNMAPEPNTVRPEPILHKALDMVKKKYKAQSVDYNYICEQLKSIRQDLTVQRINNEFTVKVYEAHARVALQFV